MSERMASWLRKAFRALTRRNRQNVGDGTSDDVPEGSEALSSRELHNPPPSTTSELDHL